MASSSLRAYMGAAIMLASSIGLVDASARSPREYIMAGGMGPCPVECSVSGYDSSNWTQYQSMEALQACDHKPKLLDFTIHTALEDDDVPFVVRACSTVRGPIVYDEQYTAMEDVKIDSNIEDEPVELQLIYSNSDDKTIANQKTTAVRELQASLLLLNNTDTGENNEYSRHIIHYGDTVVGIFIGSSVDPRSAALGPLEDFLQYSKDPKVGRSHTIAVQMCGKKNTIHETMGFIADTTPGKALYRVQSAVKAWSDAKCAPNLGQTKTFGRPSVGRNKKVLAGELDKLSTPDESFSALAACRTIQVQSGNGCAQLAKRCGISGANFTKYNPGKNFCSTLKPGQRVCCSTGTLPDIRPKPKPDGTCASRIVKSGDNCAAIAAANGLKIADLETFNKKTWGWSGCKRLFVGINMCLSKGHPALPAPIKNAQCGPQKPGTKAPKPGSDFSKLNPCPLNACCNVWGQCGTTKDFCTKSSLGPPGTSKPGQNGCVSNCGTDIVNNDKPPAQFKKIGYFEAWSEERPCLHMDMDNVPKGLTHIHFAFADVGPGFSVSAARVKKQFEKFKKHKGAKRIVAFGGWTASTNPNSYWIFREGIKPGNRETLANNLAKFVIDNGLDGLDLDWEYPGAPDIPGIPAADPLDGKAYLELLKILRKKLPTNKSLSIAAPASFWYLKQFPIKEIAKVVDYVIYMTYDLHGQWDWGSSWASPGCPKGNCLRSHVNMTETINSLSMVTKAGVPSNKIIVGVTSYGRAFRMENPKCTGVTCKFTGPDSGAKPGRCTGERGYLANAEIREILKGDPHARTYYDKNSMTNVLVYGNDWVAYMGEKNKAERQAKWKSLNFGGTSDWAVDLDYFGPGDKPPLGGIFPELPVGWEKFDCDDPYAMDELLPEADRWKHLKCDDAFQYAIGRWEMSDKKNTGLEFTQYLSTVLSGPPGMKCGITNEQNGCDDEVACGSSHGLNASAALVLRSFSVLNQFYIGLYAGIESAHNSLESMLEDFAETFAPKEEVDEALLGFLDFLGTGLGLVSGPLFGKAFQMSKFFTRNPDIADSLEETTMEAVDYGLNEAKEAVADEETLPTKELAEALWSFTRYWKKFVVGTQKRVFSGKEEDIKYLKRMISHGKMLNIPTEPAIDVEDRVARALFAHLIPYAWSLRGVRPVLLDPGVDCSNVGALDYEFIIPGDTEKSEVCIDNKKYYLLYPDGLANDCNRYGLCKRGVLSVPPGLDKLGSKTGTGVIKYGGITKLDIAKSILLRYKDTGNKKLDKTPSLLSDKNVKEDLWSMIDQRDGDPVMLKGVINIPVCGTAEVWDNWKKETAGQDITWAAYPCKNAD